MSVEARGGYCYFLTFTDDLSRCGCIYLMKHKSETFEKFKQFQSEVENHHNKKIELDEVVEPLLPLDGGAGQREICVDATSVEEEANNDDHEASDQVTVGPRRSTRSRTTPEWYGNLVLCIMLLDNNEPVD